MFYDISYVLLIPAIILTFYAQAKVKSNFNKYSKVRNKRGITGERAARMVLDANGLRDIPIVPISGSLTDHYDPKKHTVNLSETVYGQTSISAIAVACHETGHAIQHNLEYGPLEFRSTLFPVVRFTSTLSWPIAIIGIVLLGAGSYQLGNLLFLIGVAFFSLVVLFHLVTLPVEFNASKRALDQMVDLSIIDEGERTGAKKVLSAAALTYVAALATALANLLRLFAMRSRSR